MKEIKKEKELPGDEDAGKDNLEDSDSDIEFVPYTKPPPVVVDLDLSETEDEAMEDPSKKKSNSEVIDLEESLPKQPSTTPSHLRPVSIPVPTRYAPKNAPAQPNRPNISFQIQKKPPPVAKTVRKKAKTVPSKVPQRPMPPKQANGPFINPWNFPAPPNSFNTDASFLPNSFQVPQYNPNPPMQAGYPSMEFNCFFPPAVQQGGPPGMGFPPFPMQPPPPLPLFSIRFPLQQSNHFPAPPQQNPFDIFPPGVSPPAPGPQASSYQQLNPNPNPWFTPTNSGFSATRTPSPKETHRFQFPSGGGGMNPNSFHATAQVPSQSQNRKRVEQELANTGEGAAAAPQSKKNRFDTETMLKRLKIHMYLNDRLSSMPTFNKTLERIFSLLPVKDKKNFRLVSKFWKESTIENWRKSVKICMPLAKKEKSDWTKKSAVDGKPTRRTNWSLTLNSLFSFKKKIFVVPSNPAHYFRNFFIGEGNFTLPPVPTNPTDIHSYMNWFFDNCGAHTESLELGGVQFWSKWDIVDGIRWMLLEKCKNLRELSFTSYLSKDEKSRPGQQSGNKLKKKIAPHLTSLELKSDKSNWAEVDYLLSIECCRKLLETVPNLEVLKFDMDAINLLYLLKAPSESNDFIRLKTLQIKALLSPLNLHDLSEYVEKARPKLKNLLFGADEYDIRNDLFHFDKILDTSSVTRNLTHLSLNLKFSRNRFWITQLSGRYLPRLTHLSLKIEASASRKTYDPIRLDFQLLLGIPKVQVLECFWSDVEKNGCGPVNTRLTQDRLLFSLDGGNQSGGNKDKKEVKNLMMNVFKGSKHMTEFYFCLNERFDKSGLVKLALWMPNLKKLAIAVAWDTFSLIFSLWRNLDSLTLLPGTSGVKHNEIIAQLRKYKKPIRVHKMYGDVLVFDSKDYL